MICSSAFWKQKGENLKNISLPFFKFNSNRPTLSLARGTNRQFYCTGVIIYNKLDNYFVVSADRQTFLGFEMTANFRDTSPLNSALSRRHMHLAILYADRSKFHRQRKSQAMRTHLAIFSPIATMWHFNLCLVPRRLSLSLHAKDGASSPVARVSRSSLTKM